MRRFLLLLFIIFSLALTQDDDYDEDEEEDPLSIGGGTQQTCDACRTVMDQLLQEWHTLDDKAFLEAINEAGQKKEYVPVVPEEEKERKDFQDMVVKRFAKRCKNIDIWIQYKPHVRKACETIVKTSGADVARILVEKNKQVDTDIMNYLTRVVCMGLNQMCTIRYLNLDARSADTQCENCVNVARLLEFQTRRASRKYIARGFFFDSLLETVCEAIPFYYSHPSEIGLLCEEMVSDYDEKIVKLLQRLADGDKKSVEKDICVDMSHFCSVDEYTKIQNYDYHRAMYDFQDKENIRSMPMNEEL